MNGLRSLDTIIKNEFTVAFNKVLSAPNSQHKLALKPSKNLIFTLSLSHSLSPPSLCLYNFFTLLFLSLYLTRSVSFSLSVGLYLCFSEKKAGIEHVRLFFYVGSVFLVVFFPMCFFSQLSSHLIFLSLPMQYFTPFKSFMYKL